MFLTNTVLKKSPNLNKLKLYIYIYITINHLLSGQKSKIWANKWSASSRPIVKIKFISKEGLFGRPHFITVNQLKFLRKPCHRKYFSQRSGYQLYLVDQSPNNVQINGENLSCTSLSPNITFSSIFVCNSTMKRFCNV